MAKTREQLKPNYAPLYCAAMYPLLAGIFHDHGYALAVHGSLARDFDVIAVPWAEKVSKPETVLRAIKKKTAVEQYTRRSNRSHGRVAYFLNVGFGECGIDLSFFPAV